MNGDTIGYTPTEYYFQIFELEGYHNSFIANFSPGDQRFQDGSPNLDWGGIKAYFYDWLNYLKREIAAPDKWALLIEGVNYLSGPFVNELSKFDHSEYLDISNKIEQIKSNLTSIPLLQQQSIAIENQLDRLLQLTEELNKFDWKNLFIGTIISVIIQLNVTQENAHLLYELIKKVFHGLLLQ
jgi:hypothetical protein